MPRGVRNATKSETTETAPPAGLPEHRPEDLDPKRKAVQTGPIRYNCVCPHCGYAFIVGPFDAVPDPETSFRCADCRGEYPLAKYLAPKSETIRFFGEPVTCRSCATVYRPKQSGAGAFNVETGTGGDWRACPTCGVNPPGMPTYNTLEDPNVKQAPLR